MNPYNSDRNFKWFSSSGHLIELQPSICGQIVLRHFPSRSFITDRSVDEWISEVTRPLDEWVKFPNATPAISILWPNLLGQIRCFYGRGSTNWHLTITFLSVQLWILLFAIFIRTAAAAAGFVRISKDGAEQVHGRTLFFIRALKMVNKEMKSKRKEKM